MQVLLNPPLENFADICKRPHLDWDNLIGDVNIIIEDVKNNGDKALKKYTHKFDKVYLDEFRVNESEIEGAESAISESLKSAIKSAIKNVHTFHANQILPQQKIETVKGVKCWQQSVPIEKVGLYIPGGSSPLFSTVIMLGVPAKLAGCEEVIVCSPPTQNGTIHPAILYTCAQLGIHKIFKTGGAQAIAAMAFGTKSIPKVFKIFGPGNQYVTMAKQILQRKEIAIDLPAGPSEVTVLADKSANPDFIASDLLAQAEHGPDSQVMLITTEKTLIDQVEKFVQKQINELPKKDIAEKALQNSKMIFFNEMQQAINLVNQYAPEHLIVMTSQPNKIIPKIKNAGSVFLGSFTPEAAGDYASGTNHTLPTNGYARMYSGVSLASFYKTITFQEINSQGLKNLGPTIQTLATAEDLIAHQRSVEIRLKTLQDK